MTVTLATYNTASYSDYLAIHKLDKKKFSEDTRNEMGKKVIALLKNYGAEIFALQESWDALDHWLDPKEYHWIGRKSGEAIVWNPKRFTPLAGSLQSGDMFIALDLLDQQTNKVVRIASMHIIGYNLEALQSKDHPQHQDTLHTLQKETEPKLSLILKTLTAENSYNLCLIGSDTNSDPSIYTGIHECFQNQGFSYTNAQASTNYNPFSQKLPKRNLDFIFTSEKASTYLPLKELKLGDPQNPSDHLPLIQTIGLPSSILKTLTSYFTSHKPLKKVNKQFISNL
ncbi:endonuclease/exonuclease/phosphatase family protein [Candidatus Neptunochlamydia vexilliferae]|uniref:Endonuclease/exonuclease/phosphatase domain-containing protein n=1 Tax=Candidatus Neptunichlamydia vexilliferae TaxID=1651774 RepID=A0ABS0AXA2_9BACT|nr:endonuclease/exonuclease/phosphatase family protein [Candidatus Neptunochlamydia vexilliferae]MBF5058758.1 hypothetical protein [Candidatus Neptunochlamydia vexilliferae]